LKVRYKCGFAILNTTEYTNDATDTVEAPEYEPPEGTQEDASRNEGLGNNPSFSLAGPGGHNQNSNTYISSEYRRFNPQYGKEQNDPTWSLAQPLPHIVRPGMRHGALPEDRSEDRQAGQDPAAGEKQDQRTDPMDTGFFNTWSMVRHYLREPMAEWLGVST
jgi:aquaglyceroporin related protein